MLGTADERLGLLAMVLLVFQGTGLSLALRFAHGGEPYLSSVLVAVTEMLKLVICTGMHCAHVMSDLSDMSSTDPTIHTIAVHQALLRDCTRILQGSLPMAVPATLFVMQQLLVIVAGSNLSAVTFQVFSQSFKIVPTAIFAVWLLGQRLTTQQWMSLPVLVAGVILVTSSKSQERSSHKEGNWLVGMFASSLSGISSAFAGVYFEKYVKGKQSSNLYIRNMQLSLYGLPLSVMYAFAKDGSAIRTDGFFKGFRAATWSVVFLQVFGGLITAMVVKYTDNILKNFANAASVVCTVLLAMLAFGMQPSFHFLGGVISVSLSVFLYAGVFSTGGIGSSLKRRFRSLKLHERQRADAFIFSDV